MTNADKSTPDENMPPRRKPVRDTGFPPAVRKLIDWRDSDQGLLLPYVRCQACGRVIRTEDGSRQHRIARHMGGTRDPRLSAIANGVWMCGNPAVPRSCNAAAEARDPALYKRGFWRWQYEVKDLPLIPVVRFNQHAYWPTLDGRWVLEAPAGDAA